MDSLPKQHELISFFEVEPALTDPGMPWAYNELRFVTRREHDLVEFEIAPGYETARLRWSRDHMLLVKLDLNGVRAIRTELEAKTELLWIEFRTEDILSLRPQLKPTVSIEWGTEPSS